MSCYNHVEERVSMSSTPESIQLEDWIRDIPDFPQRGILFKDITPLLQNATAFHAAMDRLAAHYAGAGIEMVVGVESDRKSTRLNSSHPSISYAVFCLKKKINTLAEYTM